MLLGVLALRCGAPVVAPHATDDRVSRSAERAADAAARHRRRSGAGTRRSSIRWRLVESAGAALRAGSIGAGAADVVRRRPRSCNRRTRRARRCCCSAPTASAATCSAGCCSARACRSASRSSRRSARCCSAALVGAVAGYAGGAIDDVLMRASDFVLVLPAMYVALALRSVLPLVLSPATVFVLLDGDLRGRRRAVHRARRARHRARRSGGSTTRSPPRRSAPAICGCSSGICCPRRAASSPSR